MRFITVLFLIITSSTLNSQVFESKKDLVKDDKVKYSSEFSIGLTGSLNFNTHQNVVNFYYLDIFDKTTTNLDTNSSLYNTRSDNETYSYGLAFQYKIKQDNGYIFSISSRMQIDDKSFLNREAVITFQDKQRPDDETSALYTKEYDISYFGFDATYDYYLLGSDFTISAGPAFRYLLNAEMTENYNFDESLTEEEIELLQTNNTEDISNELNSFLFGIRANIGYSVSFGKVKAKFTGGINTYFTPVWKDTNWDVSDVFSALEILYTF